MATHDKQEAVQVRTSDGPADTTYLRKDQHFLADGVWYLTFECPIHGYVDEAVSWDEAKTPHHAGVIADTRHTECIEKHSVKLIEDAAKEEIRVAKGEVTRMRGLIASTKKAINTFANESKAKVEVVAGYSTRGIEVPAVASHEARLAEAMEMQARGLLASYEWGLEQAKIRYEEIKVENSGPRMAPQAHVSGPPRRARTTKKTRSRGR